MPFPFEVEFEHVETDLDRFVDAVFGALESEFLVMPRGKGFVDFPTFDDSYELLKRITSGFRDLRPTDMADVILDQPVSLIVLRCMLGFTPPEWAYLATRYTEVEVTQGAARSLDRRIRTDPDRPLLVVPGILVLMALWSAVNGGSALWWAIRNALRKQARRAALSQGPPNAGQ